jgi:hypothetical protein
MVNRLIILAVQFSSVCLASLRGSLDLARKPRFNLVEEFGHLLGVHIDRGQSVTALLQRGRHRLGLHHEVDVGQLLGPAACQDNPNPQVVSGFPERGAWTVVSWSGGDYEELNMHGVRAGSGVGGPYELPKGIDESWRGSPDG